MTRWHPPPRPSSPPTVTLTARQADALALLCVGLTNEQIARRLHVTVDSVKTQLRRIYPVLGARGRTHAVALAVTGHVVIEVDEKGRAA